LYYTASGIITRVGGRPVHGTATYRSIPNLCQEQIHSYALSLWD